FSEDKSPRHYAKPTVRGRPWPMIGASGKAPLLRRRSQRKRSTRSAMFEKNRPPLGFALRRLPHLLYAARIRQKRANSNSVTLRGGQTRVNPFSARIPEDAITEKSNNPFQRL